MDIVQDFIDVITSMCSRICGMRSAKNKVDKIKVILDDSIPDDTNTERTSVS